MSGDTVDDLHAAEDLVGLLTGALDSLVLSLTGPPADYNVYAEALDGAIAALAEGQTYCRPSCEHEDDEWLCGDCCGCPGHHAEPGHA